MRHARRDLPARVLCSRKSFRGALQRCGSLPGFPRSAADARPPCSACRPICPGGGAERRIREGPRRPASPPNYRRRADAARNSVGMLRVRRVPGNSPAALEQACGRWGPKGRRAGSAPLGRLGGSSHLCAGGTGGGSTTSTSKVGPSRQAGRMALWGCSGPNEEPWLRGGRLWCKAAFAGFGCRSSCSRAPPAENRPIGNSPQWDDSA